ncbi:MAG: hypothetical protein WBD75_11955 [Phycisphaerae bacterium]
MGFVYFLRHLAEWWAGLDWKLRLGFPVFLLLISTILYFCDIIWPWGWGVGIVLLLFSGRSESEKKGYRF